MDKRFLEECLSRGMSLEAIGEAAGRHPSTVSYWLKKHGLSAVGASTNSPKGGIAQVQLETFIGEGLTLRQMASELDRSVATVRHWIQKSGLEVSRSRSCFGPAPKKVTRKCRRHGETTFVLEGSGYYRCRRCRAEAVGKRRRTVKRKLVEEAGGRCVICGYSRCQRALEFHHVDPSTKEFHLGHKGVCRSLLKSRAEAEKCVLLCANCHAEVEAELVPLPVHCGEAVPR